LRYWLLCVFQEIKKPVLALNRLLEINPDYAHNGYIRNFPVFEPAGAVLPQQMERRIIRIAGCFMFIFGSGCLTIVNLYFFYIFSKNIC